MRFHELTKEQHMAKYRFDDMFPFMETLTSYALKVESILEIGTRSGQSTDAFILGAPASITCCDYHHGAEIERLRADAEKAGIEFNFLHMNSADIEMLPVDLVFIDGEHSYVGGTRDLNKVHAMTRKFIILHDHCYFPGIKQAIDEFVAAHPEWAIREQDNTLHGLTVLERVINN